MCSLSEIGSTISNLFGGGSKTEETGEVSSEGSSEETASEVHKLIVVYLV